MTAKSGFSLHSNDGVCECMNWMKTYKSGAVRCGAGSEYYYKTSEHLPGTVLIDKETNSGLGEMLCSGFYEKLNTNKCVNINMGRDEGQWCYVDTNCRSLNNGGRIPNTQVSWKMCKAGTDSMLRDSTPEELVDFSREQNVWLAVLHKMSYPMSREGEKDFHLWRDVKEAFGVNSTVGVWVPSNKELDMPGMLAAEMAKVKQLRSGYSFETKVDGGVPQIIVYRNKFYLVEGDKVAGTDPSSWSHLRCIGGC